MAFNTFSFVTSLILTIILLPLSALVLKLVSKWFKLENTGYGTAFKISLILSVLGLIEIVLISFIPSLKIIIYIVSFIIILILAFLLVRNNYNTETGKTIWILLVWGIISDTVPLKILSE